MCSLQFFGREWFPCDDSRDGVVVENGMVDDSESWGIWKGAIDFLGFKGSDGKKVTRGFVASCGVRVGVRVGVRMECVPRHVPQRGGTNGDFFFHERFRMVRGPVKQVVRRGIVHGSYFLNKL